MTAPQSQDEYTPMTSDIRDAWATDEQGYRYGAHDAEFDRWLAAEKAAVWDQAVASLRYSDGSPVGVITNSNPYRQEVN